MKMHFATLVLLALPKVVKSASGTKRMLVNGTTGACGQVPEFS
jgi:hypothetical protein